MTHSYLVLYFQPSKLELIFLATSDGLEYKPGTIQVDLMGVIGHFNSLSSTIQVLEELSDMSNDRSLSHHCILSRFAEITGKDQIC